MLSLYCSELFSGWLKTPSPPTEEIFLNNDLFDFVCVFQISQMEQLPTNLETAPHLRRSAASKQLPLHLCPRILTITSSAGLGHERFTTGGTSQTGYCGERSLKTIYQSSKRKPDSGRREGEQKQGWSWVWPEKPGEVSATKGAGLVGSTSNHGLHQRLIQPLNQTVGLATEALACHFCRSAANPTGCTVVWTACCA